MKSSAMIETSIAGYYRMSLLLAAAIVAIGFYFYLRQLDAGLRITGLGRDVAWGLYIAQFTVAEGLAAAAIVVLVPLYVHGAAEFEPIALPGVLLAIAGIVMCICFIVADLGQPSRVFNVILHPTPWSMMFWDLVFLGGYLLLNTAIAVGLLQVRRTGFAPPAWLRPVVLVSLPWGFAVHTVTAFLFSGLPGHPFWNTAILAPRFLASAFATSSALLLLLCVALRGLAGSKSEAVVIRKLALVMTYAAILSLFLMLPELFSALYGQLPGHAAPWNLLYQATQLAPFMWLSIGCLVAAVGLRLAPSSAERWAVLVLSAVLTVLGIWLDKGLGFVVAGFAPTPTGGDPVYAPTIQEWAITAGIWGVGALILLIAGRVALAAGWERRA